MRWPALLVGTAMMAWVGSTIENNPISFGNINQIESINPTGALLTEINDSYSAANSNFNGIDNNLSLFKLYIGQFDEVFTTGIKIDTEYSLYQEQKGINIIQFTYMTEGQFHLVEGKDIELDFTPGKGTDGSSPNIPLPNVDVNLSQSIGIVIAVVVALFSIINLPGGLTRLKMKDFIKILIISAILGFLGSLAVEYIFNNTISFINTIRIRR